MFLPNFLIAGASRSGTSSLHEYLASHPDVFMSRPKELHFFDENINYRKGIEFYQGYFNEVDSETAVGEATPLYFPYGLIQESKGEWYIDKEEDVPRRIRDTMPDCRIILTLRHPVHRLYSQYLKNHWQGKISESFAAWIQNQEEAFNSREPRIGGVYQNRYGIHLRRWYDLFDESQIKVLIFEEWTQNPYPFMLDVCRFLGIDPYDFSENAFEKRNPASKYRPRHTKLRLMSKYIPRRVKTSLKRLMPEKKRGYPSMKNHTREWLLDKFESDIQETEKILNRNLDIWRR